MKEFLPRNSEEFDQEFYKVFDNTSFETLVSSNMPRVRLEMGGDLKGSERVEQVVERSYTIISRIFCGNSFWIRLVFWDDIIESSLLNYKIDSCGFQITKSIFKFKKKEGIYTVVYLYLSKSMAVNMVRSLLESIANRELGLVQTADITAYFIRFSGSSVVVNLYDDRGIDIIQKDEAELQRTIAEFHSWISLE